MKLSNLSGRLSAEDVEFSAVSFDSKNTRGSVYFCLKGSKDGHDYAKEALDNGAIAIVSAKKLNINLPQLIVEDTRVALTQASAMLFGSPEKNLKMVGITGTNGKTTTSFILSSILSEHGKNVGIIGTNGAHFMGKTVDLQLTTPDPPQLFSLLRDMVDSGVEYVIMEVSAHALALGKVSGIVYDVAAFTNLSQDHLDFFGDMDTYASAKGRLFTPLSCKSAVINIDDEFGKKLVNSAVNPITYGCNAPADVFAIDLRMSVGGLEYVLNLMDEVVKIKFSMTGRFNMYNTLCAAAVASRLDVPIKAIAEGIRKLKRVDGRYNIINTSACSVIIDFAHTDDGLKNIIGSIREYAQKRIITVFGCGGDRDKAKRPIMGEVVGSLSDYCVITSDNPRSENPESIISDIVSGAKKTGKNNYICLTDRRQAIRHALTEANEGDIVLIAGKGAEKTQEIKGIKYPYSDGEYVLKLIEELCI